MRWEVDATTAGASFAVVVDKTAALGCGWTLVRLELRNKDVQTICCTDEPGVTEGAGIEK